MEVSVREAAEALSVTPRRVQALIAAGRIRARKISGVWLVDASSLPAAPRRSRPMSPTVAWAFLADEPPASPQAAYRWQQRRARLAADPDPATLLASWVASRGHRVEYTSKAPRDVLDDNRVVPTGVSDTRSGLAVRDTAEVWVRSDDLDTVRRTHLLRPAESTARANVILHVLASGLPGQLVSRLLLAADLADWGEARELASARRLVQAALR